VATYPQFPDLPALTALDKRGFKPLFGPIGALFTRQAPILGMKLANVMIYNDWKFPDGPR